MSLTLRRFLASDAASLHTLHDRLEPHGPPATIGSGDERWVAVRDGALVGSGRIEPAWWTGDPHAFQVAIQVDPDAQRQGIGTALWETLQGELAGRDARSLTAWVPGEPGNLAFAARHGFAQTEQTIREFRLDTAEAVVDDRPDPDGLIFTPLAGLTLTEPFLRSLRAIWAGEDEAEGDLDAWRREVVAGPDLSLATHWVALDGRTPVGMTFLRRLSDDAADNDFTGTLPAYRGRGIASALKRRAIRWAQANRVRWFYTSSLLENAPMIAVNTRLGYQPGALRHQVARTLSG